MVKQQNKLIKQVVEKETKKYVCCLRTKQYCEHICKKILNKL